MLIGRTGGVDQREEARELFQNLKRAQPELEQLLRLSASEFVYADGIYRFYHQSFKVFSLQMQTTSIVEQLRKLAPERPLHHWFARIIHEGTNKKFVPEVNQHWSETTRPILEAFFHAKFMLEMAVQSARDLVAPPLMLPSNWAALLYLFQLR